METTIEEVKRETITKIREQTNDILNTLKSLWSETYDTQNCISYAENLSKHVNTLYDEIIAEGKFRYDTITMNNNHLYAEACLLKTLLTSNINLSPDIPLHSLQLHLIECVSNLRQEVGKRQNKIKSLIEEQKALCKELDEYPKPLNNGPVLPTEEDLIGFRQYLDDLIVEKQTRHTNYNMLQNDIDDLLTKLGAYYEVSPGDETIMYYSQQLTKPNLAALTNLRDHLIVLHYSLRQKIDDAKRDLLTIWKLLELEDDTIKGQFDVVEYDYETCTKLTKGLDYWKKEWLSKIKAKIIETRLQITDLWSKTLCSESDKSNFSPFTSDSFSEELLLVHETELIRLQEYYNSNKNLFDLIGNWKDMLHHLYELNIKCQDPARLKNRGGKLLQEQKDTGVAVTKISKIEFQILKQADAYYKSTSTVFIVDGLPIKEYILRERKSSDELIKILKTQRKSLSSAPSVTSRSPAPRRYFNSTVKSIPNVSNIRLAKGSGVQHRLRVPNNIVRGAAVRRIILSPNRRPRRNEPNRSVPIRRSIDHRIATGRIGKTRVLVNNTMSGTLADTQHCLHAIL